MSTGIKMSPLLAKDDWLGFSIEWTKTVQKLDQRWGDEVFRTLSRERTVGLLWSIPLMFSTLLLLVLSS